MGAWIGHAEVLAPLYRYCELVFSLIRTAYVTYGGLGNPILLSQTEIGTASIVFADDFGFFIC